MHHLRRQSVAGQATVEFVALLPLVILAITALLQVALVAHAAWAAEQAARSAARAAALGLDAPSAALRALPAHLEAGLRVKSSGNGSARVSLEVPRLLPGIRLGEATARATFHPQS